MGFLKVLVALVLAICVTTWSPSKAYAVTWSNVATGSRAWTTTATTFTLSYNNSTGDLVVLNVTREGATHDITAVSYGGVAMTSVGSINAGTDSTANLYYLLSPATGTNDFSVTTTSGTKQTALTAASFTGAAQSGQPDAAAVSSTGNGSSETITITTASDNAAFIGACADNNGSLTTAGSGTTLLVKDAVSISTLIASNPLAVTPAGSKSIIQNNSNSAAQTGCIGLSFKIASDAPAVSSIPYFHVFWW